MAAVIPSVGGGGWGVEGQHIWHIVDAQQTVDA